MDFANFRRLFTPLGTRLFRQAPGQERREDLYELSPEDLQDHLGGGPHLGAYVQRADGTVRFSMFDIDISPRNVPREEMLSQMEDLKPLALSARDALEARGLARDQVLVEYSGTGYHLWVFYEEPVPAALIQRVMHKIQGRRGLELPFKPQFPFERDRDRVWLPLRVNRNQGVRSCFVSDLEGFDPAHYPREVRDELLATVRPVDPKSLI